MFPTKENKPYEVGKARITFADKRRYFLYKNCIPLFSDWYDCDLYLPKSFDLCFLHTQNGIKIGWWTGEEWFGKKVKSSDVVSLWKLSVVDL